MSKSAAERFAEGLQEIVEPISRAQYPILWRPESEGGYSGGRYTVFSVDKPGRKFTRIVEASGGQRHVHAFVENATGAVFKAAGWSAPAKGARYESVEAALEAVAKTRSTNGGYLYADSIKAAAAK